MRTLNSLKNIISGVSGQIITLVLQFISRTVFIHTLGIEYLGVSGLFTNVISILNITELGIGTAIVYSLYKPLAEKDIITIKATMNLYRKAYFAVGCAIACIGLILLPFLPFVMKGSTNLVNVQLIYILYVFQSVSTYWFFAYKSSLLIADQKKYIFNFIRYIIMTISTITQIALLLLFKSFMLYTVIGILSNIILNIFIAKKVDKLYPYIKNKTDDRLPKESTKEIFKNVFGMSMYKINSVIVRSTDNIVISAFISVTAVGLYANYLMITTSLIAIIKLVFSAVTASVGNLYASDTKERNEFIFRCLNMLSFWIYSVCGICLWVLFNPFITLWIGKEFLLNLEVVFLIALNFVMDGFQNVSIIYKDACGLFWKGRYRPVATAIINVVLSVLLAPKLGISGVLLGTIISRLFTTWWYEPWMIYKFAFNMSSKRYFTRYIFLFSLVVVNGILLQFLILKLPNVTWIDLIIKLIICIIMPNTVFYLVFRQKEEFNYLIDIIKHLKGSFNQNNIKEKVV